ncbi:MAG: LysR family transcriptional regulator [Proteobacteria bacterium]|nr:LysR family transcriptional regulator [Pseudomonadota bacterium]
MEFRQIRYALAVARERSFTRASGRLNVSQSAISEQVRLLEQQLKFPLFRRTGRGVELTERGRAFLHEAERVMTDVLGLDDTARRLRGAAGDTFMLGTGSGMAQLFMPRLFGQFHRVAPEIRLEILTAPTRNIFRELQEQRLDAGIALDSDPEKVPAGVVIHQLADAELAIIAHPEHRITKVPPPIDIGGLVSEPIIMSELSVGYGETVTAMFSDLGIRPYILAVADNIETMKVIVQSGSGIAIVPRAAVANEVALGVLAALAIAPPRAVRFSLFRRRQAMSRKKEELFAFLKEVLTD